MALERSRKMELLYTPRSELTKMMKENSVSAEELIFLSSSNKVTPAEIRMNAPTLNDKLVALLLKHWSATTDSNNTQTNLKSSSEYEQESQSSREFAPQVIA